MTIEFPRVERSAALRARNGTAAALIIVALLAAPAAKSTPDFAREVPALFEKHCLKCHGPEKQKGGLRFDRKEGALTSGDSGEKAIVPGKASDSRLIKLVSSEDEDERMPPKDGPLSAAEIALLRQWIDAGAPWPDKGSSTSVIARSEMIVTDEDRKHWSFLPLKRPPVPVLKEKATASTPVDHFIMERLTKAGIQPSPPASATKLVRRIYFDLVGLPPTPEQIDSFKKDFKTNSRAAVESLVDQLLATPHYGERWGRHWLDVVRYADSDGQESDHDRLTAYHYRDFVIRSFNEDRPFNTFLQW
jgi:mono/diheme cytochrome c family protein